jgi:hypothetical protein
MTEVHVPASAPRSLAPRIWADFAAEVWEKFPALLPRACPDPPATPEIAFAALVQAADQARTHGHSQCFNVWRAGNKLDAFIELLPESADGHIESYLRRVDRLVGGDDFTLLLANPHLVSREIQRRMWFFVKDMFVHVGQPCGGIDSGIFVGNYSRTPFGVHRGQMSVMTFPLLGAKRFLLWPRGYGQEHAEIEDSLSYDAHRAAAEVRVAQRSDVMYWPADWWHIADGEKSFSAAFNIGFWWDKPPLDRALFAMSEVLSQADPLHDRADDGHDPLQISFPPPSADSASSPELNRAVEWLRSVVCDRRLTDQLQADWLAFRSGQCLRDLPPIPAELPPVAWGSTLAPFAVGAVLLAPLDSHRVLVAANGLVQEFSSSPEVLVLGAALAAGRPVQLMRPPDDAQASATLLALAAFIVGSGAADIDAHAR